MRTTDEFSLLYFIYLLVIVDSVENVYFFKPLFIKNMILILFHFKHVDSQDKTICSIHFISFGKFIDSHTTAMLSIDHT